MKVVTFRPSPRCGPFDVYPRKIEGGFTAIELMVVVAILAILVALAAPSFTPLIERWRVRQASDALSSTLYFSRSEAIKRGGNIVIAKKPNSISCTRAGTDTDWGCGWVVFFDVNSNGVQDACVAGNTPNECDLQTVDTPPKTDVTLAASTGSISVDRWGMLFHTGGNSVPTSMSFELVPTGKTITDSSSGRLCTGNGGRIALKKGSETC